ncbi:unnamed protein product [Bemisia tabaci]|uniref:Uncharacterized protein n=1 Tax=Bemisia tabaci TaxID=7038 RepID=A0A9P0AKQ8_BEMTA|nr:unnamed protein product [Bemisia tabaci]
MLTKGEVDGTLVPKRPLSESRLFVALDLAANSNVQDAFVIAVEQKARERLERLAFLNRIKPVDMTKLSLQGFPTVRFTALRPVNQEGSFCSDASPVQFKSSS